MILYYLRAAEIYNQLKNVLNFSADYKHRKRNITGRCKLCNVIKNVKLKRVLCAIATPLFTTPLHADCTIFDSGTTASLNAVDSQSMPPPAIRDQREIILKY